MANSVPKLTTSITIAIAIALATLAYFGYRATREWQRSTRLFVERRTEETADLLVTALTRDMRGVQNSVLASRDWTPYSEDSLTDMSDPYPESFFRWQAGPDQSVVFFNRANRYPVWMPAGPTADRYPVNVVTDAAIGPALFQRIQRDARAGRRYSIFETRLGNERYQVVARLQYQGPFRENIENVFGYTVNLDWAERSYFAEITAQVERIDRSGIDLHLAVFDEKAHLITGSSGSAAATLRQFPLLFFDPATVILDPPPDLDLRNWTVRVSGDDDSTLIWATDWIIVVITAIAMTLGVSLVFTYQAVRANAALAELRSDFVSTVTHELRTPLATIRAVGDTLVKGRVTSAEAVQIVEEVLDTVINPSIVKHINASSGRAVGIPGKRVLVGRKLAPVLEGEELVDFGFVGEVIDVRLDEIERAIAAEAVPVISPLAQDVSGASLNINADIAAGTIAGGLRAAKMIYLSDVPGIMRDHRDPTTLIASVNRAQIQQLVSEGIIAGGMLPKVNSALNALEKGVRKVHFIDGRLPHALLQEVFTDEGIGTEIVR